MERITNVVLVHGGFVDGAGWEGERGVGPIGLFDPPALAHGVALPCRGTSLGCRPRNRSGDRAPDRLTSSATFSPRVS